MSVRFAARGLRLGRTSVRALAFIAVALTTSCAAALHRTPPGMFVASTTRGSTITLDVTSTLPDRVCDRVTNYCANALPSDVQEALGVMLAFYFTSVPGPRTFASRLHFDQALVVPGAVPRFEVRWRFDLRDQHGSLIVEVSGRSDAAIDAGSKRLSTAAAQRLQDSMLERIRIALRNADLG